MKPDRRHGLSLSWLSVISVSPPASQYRARSSQKKQVFNSDIQNIWTDLSIIKCNRVKGSDTYSILIDILGLRIGDVIDVIQIRTTGDQNTSEPDVWLWSGGGRH